MKLGLVLAAGVALAGLAWQPARAANLVVNGDFGTGDFTGWAQPIDPSIVIDTAFAPPLDSFDAMFTGGGTLSQLIPTTAGKGYALSFSLLDEAAFFLDTFTVSFGGFSTTIAGDTAASYQPEVFDIPGADVTGASTTLSFQGTSLQAWNLADVTLSQTAIPEAPAGAILAAGVLMTLSLYRRGRLAGH